MIVESLAPELLSLILQSIESPRSLHNLISASPVCLRVFNQTSRLILSAVIQNTLPIINKRHLLALYQAPSPATRTGVSSFLDKYFDESSSFDFPTGRAELVELYKIYNRLSFLINEYLKRVDDLGLDDTILTPSRYEVTRLQRAFLRYGLYSRVFPADDTRPWEDPSPNHNFSAGEQFDLFINHLYPWECEEMVCVEQYFSILIGDFVDEIEDQLAEVVKSVLVPKTSKLSEESKDDSRDTSVKEDLRHFRNLDLTRLSMFSSDNRSEIHHNISYLASLGLDFVYDLIRADQEERSRLIRSNSPNFRDFLQEALNHSPDASEEREEDMASWEDDPFSIWEDEPSCNNLGWTQFGLPNRHREYLGIDTWGYLMSPLQELGYIFWDSSRFRSGLVDEKLRKAGAMSSEERKTRFSRRGKETFEELFKGYMIPGSELTRLESQFGYIRRPIPDESG
ncbi:uncharacterized protein B0J16DRAFT_374159 [Fusarium flagelliforme]|uniref:Uncharacterized protein n=1 Tax=Fusarium flagelliforme TaxID=2675880 RepID=A0A395M700_9HYPO|nr:uncharacterized protein B0J16DRAFT_374159 [Fusarium flagelliforme]KAH7179052.1 hypothetical protein B0J16DRAFT_374159 [Fusarium flagelliforme]RFN43661.1 hypothetical protein FIE12Z_12127 [Fusarium flagelliforme]